MTGRIVLVAETGSTNADLRVLVEGGWPEGQWLRAERQTDGRGRLGRPWVGEGGNLYASTFVALRPSDPSPTDIALIAGVACHTALATLLPTGGFSLKWPNDVMIGPAKLAGVLLERVATGVIVGIGINVRSAPDLPDRETIAVSALPGGTMLDAAQILDALAERFAYWLARWREDGFVAIRNSWMEAGHPLGEALVVRLPDGETVHGRFAGLGAIGELIVGLDNGQSRAIHAGDVGLL